MKGLKASGLWWWERGWDRRPGWAPFSWGRAHLGGGLRLAEIHWVCVGGWNRILLDALKEGGKFRVGSDLGREVSHDGAFPHFWDGQQGGHCPHGRALQFILLLKLLLHRTSFDLKWETTMSHPWLSLSLHHILCLPLHHLWHTPLLHHLWFQPPEGSLHLWAFSCKSASKSPKGPWVANLNFVYFL